MKTKIFLDKNETIEEAEIKLEKSLKAKRKAREERLAKERYPDEAVEDFQKMLFKENDKIVKELLEDIQDLVRRS